MPWVRVNVRISSVREVGGFLLDFNFGTAVVKVSWISDPGPRKFAIERYGAKLAAIMHLSAVSLMVSEFTGLRDCGTVCK